MKSIYSSSLALFAIVILLSSCAVTRKYNRPDVPTDVFRKDFQRHDTANLAHIPWVNFFTDSYLQGYIAQALDSNLDLQIAIQQIATADAYLKQARAAYSPSLSVAPEASYSSQSQNTQFGQIIGSRTHIIQYGLPATLSWEADIWGKITSNKRAAVADYLRTRAAAQAVQSTLVSNLATLYFQLLAFDAQQQVLEQTILTRDTSLQTHQALKTAGVVSEVAVLQAQALVYNAQAQLAEIERQMKISEHAFSLLLGRSANDVPRTPPTYWPAPADSLLYGVPYQLLTNRPDVRAAEYYLMSAFNLTQAAKANFYPAFRITASGGFQSVDFDKLFSVRSLFANLLGNLTQPLWNKRQIRTQYEASKASQQIALFQYKQTILNAGREVSDALVTYQAQQSIQALKQKEYEAYTTSTGYAQQLVQYGMANYLEVIRAQENELSARLAYINAQLGRQRAYIQLYQALGGGWR